MMNIPLNICKTKKVGLPSLWEEKNKEYVQIIAGPTGKRKPPRYYTTRLRQKNKHALFIVNPGDLVLRLYDEFNYYTLLKINEDFISGEQIEFDKISTKNFEKMFNAGMGKIKCYKCREPHYYKVPKAHEDFKLFKKAKNGYVYFYRGSHNLIIPDYANDGYFVFTPYEWESSLLSALRADNNRQLYWNEKHQRIYLKEELPERYTIFSKRAIWVDSPFELKERI